MRCEVSKNRSPAQPDDLPAEGAVSVRGTEMQIVLDGSVDRLRRSGSDLPVTECPTNIDLRTAEGKALVMSAGNPSDYDFDNNREIRINAVHYLAFGERREDEETGELREFAVLVLFDRDGQFAKTTSAYALGRLKAALRLYSADDWSAGITWLIRERVSRRTKRTYHDIRTVT